MPDKSFRPWLPAQPLLLPTDVHSWLPDEHLVWFVLDIVERLDLTLILKRIRVKDPRGTRPYDPRMMVALLSYGYAVGVFSSRRIERATFEDVAFRILTADEHPDHDTIAAFRRDNLAEFKTIFVQVLRLAAEMGLITFGVLGLDGVKILASASKHRAMSYDRMKLEIERLTKEVEELVARADRTDGEEQARFGNGQIVDLPAEIKRRKDRKARIEEAMAALEAEAREARVAELREQAERHEKKAADESLDESDRKRAATLAQQRKEAIDAIGATEKRSADDDDHDADLPSHQVPHETDGKPKDGVQRNFTDPESRIMVRDGDHIVQAYNAQAVVDNANQIIVAGAVGNQAPDAEYLAPMVQRVDANLEAAGIEKPSSIPLAADTGFFSESNVEVAESHGYDPYIATERSRRTRPKLVEAPSADSSVAVPLPAATGPPAATTPATGPPPVPTTKEKMRTKLQTAEGKRIYGLRKTTPEPVFGQILSVRGFRRFMLRGLKKVRGEWDLVTMTHNILKLWRSGAKLPALA